MASSETVSRLAFLLSAVLLVLSALHAYWALGGTWGLAASLGRPEVEPSRLLQVAAGAVAAALVAGAAVVLGRAGAWGRSFPWFLFSWGTWGLACALALAGLLNLTARTWLERLAFAPIAFVLASIATAVARSPRP
jgi:hypothetical protein